MTLVYRVYEGRREVEVEWSVGPVPVGDGVGKEVVLRWETDVGRGGEGGGGGREGDGGGGGGGGGGRGGGEAAVFWTDANGREFQERTLYVLLYLRGWVGGWVGETTCDSSLFSSLFSSLSTPLTPPPTHPPTPSNHRPTWNVSIDEPVAGNYYPINAAAYLLDPPSSSHPPTSSSSSSTNKKPSSSSSSSSPRRQFSLLVDRSQGVASLLPGQLDLLLQRRLLIDDHRGVGEPLNGTSVHSPTHPTTHPPTHPPRPE